MAALSEFLAPCAYDMNRLNLQILNKFWLKNNCAPEVITARFYTILFASNV